MPVLYWVDLHATQNWWDVLLLRDPEFLIDFSNRKSFNLCLKHQEWLDRVCPDLVSDLFIAINQPMSIKPARLQRPLPSTAFVLLSG